MLLAQQLSAGNTFIYLLSRVLFSQVLKFEENLRNVKMLNIRLKVNCLLIIDYPFSNHTSSNKSLFQLYQAKSLKVATVVPTKHYSADTKYNRFDTYDHVDRVSSFNL